MAVVVDAVVAAVARLHLLIHPHRLTSSSFAVVVDVVAAVAASAVDANSASAAAAAIAYFYD